MIGEKLKRFANRESRTLNWYAALWFFFLSTVLQKLQNTFLLLEVLEQQRKRRIRNRKFEIKKIKKIKKELLII